MFVVSFWMRLNADNAARWSRWSRWSHWLDASRSRASAGSDVRVEDRESWGKVQQKLARKITENQGKQLKATESRKFLHSTGSPWFPYIMSRSLQNVIRATSSSISSARSKTLIIQILCWSRETFCWGSSAPANPLPWPRPLESSGESSCHGEYTQIIYYIILHYITISYYVSLILIDTDVLLMSTDVSFIWWFWNMLTTCWYWWSVWSPCASAVSRWGPASKAGKPTPTRPTDLPWTCHGLLIAFTALVLQIYASFKIQKSPNSSKLCLSFPGVLFVCWVSCLIGGSPCSGVNRNSAGKSAEKEEVSTLRATRAHWPMAGFKPSGVRLLDDSTSEL